MGIYERIKEAAQSKGISINRLEKELGFPRSSMNKYNRNTPGADKLSAIAKYLGVTVDSLTGNERNQDETGYYFDPKTAEIAQQIADNKYLGGLFDTARDAKPEDLETVQTMLEALKRKERGE